jgi:hypothetical protein
MNLATEFGKVLMFKNSRLLCGRESCASGGFSGLVVEME